MGHVFERLFVPRLTEFLLLLAIFLAWYEVILAKYLTLVGQHWLIPGLILLALLFSDKKGLRFYRAELWYLVFLLISALSGLSAVIYGLEPRLIFQGWLILAQFGLVFFAAKSISQRGLNILPVIALPLALVGFYQFFFGPATPRSWASPGESLTRIFAFFGSPNIFGILLAILALLSLGLYLKSKKALYLIIGILNLAALALTFSRTAWLGFALGLILILAGYRPKYLLFVPLALFGLIIPQIRIRLAIVFSGKYLFDSALDGRIWALNNGFYLFSKSVFFGSGPGTYGGKLAVNYASPVYLAGLQNGYPALYYTDNQYLELLVQVGIFGFLSFLAFIVSTFVALANRFRKKKDLIVLTAAAVFSCFLVAGIMANVLEYGAITLPAAFIIGVSLNED